MSRFTIKNEYSIDEELNSSSDEKDDPPKIVKIGKKEYSKRLQYTQFFCPEQFCWKNGKKYHIFCNPDGSKCLVEVEKEDIWERTPKPKSNFNSKY